MPLLQLHSLESFCAWLIDAFTSTVPFGLSLRLRPLLVSPEATASKAVVLVRPHLGHVLLSATSQESGEETLVGGAAVRQISRPSSDAVAANSAPVNDICKEASFAAVLQALLLLTRSDDSYAVKSAGATVFGAAAVDGVGRKVHLFTTFLHHCVSWWSAGDVGAAQHSLRRQLSLPFLFLGDAPVAAPVASAGGLAQEQQQQRRAQLSFLRVLRRLSQCGGWRLTSAFSRQKETLEQGEDWLDYLVRRAVTCDLQPTGDYMDFACGSLSDSSPSASPLSLPVVSVDVVRAVLWHVLSTEVDGDVLAALHRLLCDFIVFYVPGVSEREESRRGNTDPLVVPLSCVRFALERLVRQPELALLCSPAASSVSASSPPVRGPVTQSRILPAGVLVLPFRNDDGGGSSAVPSTSSPPRFFLRGVRHATGSAGKGSAVARGAVRVLLLRVDPEGGWMPSVETQACQRTFYASFQAQAERDGPRESSTSSADAVESEDEDFAAWEARGLGHRAVEKVPFTSQRDNASPRLSLGLNEHSSAEDTAVTVLTAHVLRHPPFATAVASASAADRLLWRATIRLYLYALLHRVRVVLTPEQLPAFTRAFGYRHVHSLHRVLCQVGATWMADEATTGASTLSHQVSVSRLLARVCAQDPPVAIYLVDQLSLAAFTHLQRSAPDLSPMCTAVLPVTLCRDVLRLPEWAQYPSHATSSGDSPPGVLMSATHCAVLDEQVLCTAWSAVPSSHDADSLMETCAGLEEHFLPNSRALCVVAFSPPSSAPQGHSSSATAQYHVKERDAHWRPSLLLVAPTRVHALYYCGILRKAGLALLEALPDARGSDGWCAEGITDQRSSASLSGVVRGGGAFYVALAKHLHQLRLQLCTASPSLLLSGTYGVQLGPGAGAVWWGDDIPLRERRWVCYLLHLLTEACAAVATHHAEPIIARSVGARSEPAAAGVEARTWTCGPRARRRLWLRVLRDVVEERSAAPCTTPMLHVRHLDEVRASARPREQVDEDGASETSVRDDTLLLNALGMQVFAAQEMPLRWRDAALSSAAEGMDRDAACEDSRCREPELFEPLCTNVRAVRESLALLLRTLSATIF